jgi:hypothetical protein
MAHSHKKLGLALMCADWRLHQGKVKLYEQLKRALGVYGIDINAVPGPDGLLMPERAAEWEAVLGWVKLLIEAHDPVALAVVAHQRCAGHPVSDELHEADAAELADVLKEQTGFAGPVHALVAVYHSDDKWSLKSISRVDGVRGAEDSPAPPRLA